MREAEWQSILSALGIYKNQFQTVRVPSRFVVPPEESWPTEMHGLRLGIRVAAIRATGRYVKDHPGRVQALEDMGFEWQLRAPSAPRSGADAGGEGGPEEAPGKVKKVSKAAAAKAQKALDDAEKEASASSGDGEVDTEPKKKKSPAGRPPASAQIAGDPGSVSFDALIEAVIEYGVQYPEFLNPPPAPAPVRGEKPVPKVRGRPGKVKSTGAGGAGPIPSNFVIPDAAPWPMSCRSLPLGMCLNQITTRGAYLNPAVIAEQLTKDRRIPIDGSAPAEVTEEEVEGVIADREIRLSAAGFTLKTQSKAEPQSMSKRFDRLVEALEIYSQEVGGLDVPQHFSVPESAPWPEELWGLRLGSRVNAIRSQGTFVKNNPKRRELLTGMGFRWETEAGLRAKNYQLQRAAKTSWGGEEWQTRPWAADLNLGPSDDLSNNPYYRVFGERLGGGQGDVDGLDFGVGGGEYPSDFEDMQRGHTFDDVIEALQVWKEEFGQFENIPEDFSVPFHALGSSADEGDEYGDQGPSLMGLEAELQALTQLNGQGPSALSKSKAAFEDDSWDIEAIMNQRTNLAKGPEEEGFDDFANVGASPSSPKDGEDTQLATEAVAALESAFSSPSSSSGGGVAAINGDGESMLQRMLMEGSGVAPGGLGEGFGDLGAEDLDGLFGGDDGWGDSSQDLVSAAAAAAGAILDSEEEAEVERRALQRHLSRIPWPPHLAGLPLGEFLALMRRGDVPGKYDIGGGGKLSAAAEADPWMQVLTENEDAAEWGGVASPGEGGSLEAGGSGRRQRLDKLGFTWGDEEKHLLFDFARLTNTLVVFMEMQGDMCVPTDYVVPSSKPWPTRMHGLRLGKMVNLARAQKSVLEKHYPARHMLLGDLSFQWLPPMLHDTDTDEDPAGGLNKMLVQAVQLQGLGAAEAGSTEEERAKASSMKWANMFFEELCAPIEWVRLRTALEKGFEWDEEGSATKSQRLFTLQDMYDVEALHPEEEDDDDEEEEEEEEFDYSEEGGVVELSLEEDEEDEEDDELLFKEEEEEVTSDDLLFEKEDDGLKGADDDDDDDNAVETGGNSGDDGEDEDDDLDDEDLDIDLDLDEEGLLGDLDDDDDEEDLP